MFKKKVGLDSECNADASADGAGAKNQDKEIADIKRKENLVHLSYFIAYWFFFYPFIVGVIELFGAGSFFFYILTFSYIVVSIIIAIKLRKK
jgi:hypothetical protein